MRLWRQSSNRAGADGKGREREGSSNSDAVSDAVMEWNDYADKINGKYGSVITPKLSNGENGKGKMF